MPKDIGEVSSIAELEEILRSSRDESDDSVIDTPDEGNAVNEESSTETNEGQETHQPSDEEIRSLVASIPLDQLMTIHPGVSGKIGATAQRLANELSAKQIAEQRRRELEQADKFEEEELLRLAQENPEAATRGFVERTVRQRSQKQNLEMDEATREQYGVYLSTEMDNIYRTPIMNQFAQVMDDEQLASLYWKNGKYQDFASWAQGMLETVYKFAKEEGRKEVATSTSQPKQSDSSRDQTRVSSSPARRQTDFSANLGDGIDPNVSSYRPGDVDKMPFSRYASNRQQILKDIFGEDE